MYVNSAVALTIAVKLMADTCAGGVGKAGHAASTRPFFVLDGARLAIRLRENKRANMPGPPVGNERCGTVIVG